MSAKPFTMAGYYGRKRDVAEIRDDEAEACAEIAEHFAELHRTGYEPRNAISDAFANAASDLAAAIRARIAARKAAG